MEGLLPEPPRLRRPGLIAVVLLWLLGLGVQLTPLVVGAGDPIGSMTLLFWVVVIAASLCVVTSVALLGLARRRDSAELGVVGGFFFVGSVLPLVHGITVPGVVYGPNAATSLSVYLAIPMAVAVALPLLFGRTEPAPAILRQWTRWVGAWAVLATALAVFLLVAPNAIASPAPRSPLSVGTSILMIALTAMLAAQQLRLAWIAQKRRYAIVALGFAWFGVSSAVWFDGEPLTLAFWSAHAFDIFGVLAATVGGLVVHRSSLSIDDILRPITHNDPLTALEAGLDPTVHRFVADLEAKDTITRDHVVRTAALAVAVASELRRPALEVRQIGMAALLHDLGKLAVPDEILNKNGKLTDDEFAVIKQHPRLGADLIRQSAILDDIAGLIEAHHERYDGGGYPNGTAGPDLPIGASIISACDAFDAIANTRQYRTGAGWERGLEVLAEHAGTQWHPAAVDAVAAVVRRNDGEVWAMPMRDVGRSTEAAGSALGICGCSTPYADDVARQLERV